LEDLARSIDTRSRNEEPFDVGDVDEVMGGDDKNG
jgi:hypothetical protein